MTNYQVRVYDDLFGFFVCCEPVDCFESIYGAAAKAMEYTNNGRKGMAMIDAVTEWDNDGNPVSTRVLGWIGRKSKKFADICNLFPKLNQ